MSYSRFQGIELVGQGAGRVQQTNALGVLTGVPASGNPDGHVLTVNATSGLWEARAPTGGGGGGGSADPSMLGSASFNASSGAIASLAVTGIVASVTRISTGRYRVTFATPQPDADYIVSLVASDDNTAATYNYLAGTTATYSTTQFEFYVYGNGNPRDAQVIRVGIFRYGGAGAAGTAASAKGNQGTNVTVPASTWTPVTMTVEAYDDGAMHSTVTNTSRFVAGTSGMLAITGWWQANAAVGGYLAIAIRKNGVTWLNSFDANAGRTMTITVHDKAVAGDYYELMAFATGGMTLDSASAFAGSMVVVALGGGSGASGAHYEATGSRVALTQADFAWYNQLAADETVNPNDGSIHYLLPARADHAWSARQENAPATPWTILARIEPLMFAANYMVFGLCFGNGGTASTDIMCLYCGYVDGWIELYVVNGAFGAATFGPRRMRTMPKWFGIRDDGTNWKFYVGMDRYRIYEFYSMARSYSPTKRGYFASCRTSSLPVHLAIYSWEKSTTAPNT